MVVEEEVGVVRTDRGKGEENEHCDIVLYGVNRSAGVQRDLGTLTFICRRKINAENAI